MGVSIPAIILGLVELFFGRRLFWLFVAIGGFLLGWFLVPAFFPASGMLLRVVIGVVAGVVFALLAILFTRVMVAVAGFFVFGGAAVLLVRFAGATLADGSAGYWVAYIVGGLIGAVLLFLFFDWALIILTSLAGAWAVAGGIVSFIKSEPTWLQAVLFVVLAVMGILFQSRDLRRRRSLGRFARR